jgi:hypothetical protein
MQTDLVTSFQLGSRRNLHFDITRESGSRDAAQTVLLKKLGDQFGKHLHLSMQHAKGRVTLCPIAVAHQSVLFRVLCVVVVDKISKVEPISTPSREQPQAPVELIPTRCTRPPDKHRLDYPTPPPPSTHLFTLPPPCHR